MNTKNLPLTALRVFESVARLGSFSLAAADLHVTQGAVSQQIRLLEERLGCTLLLRGRPMTQTDEGRILFGAVRSAFDVLDTGIRRITPETDSATLRFHVLPTFSIMWLMPQLSRFRSVASGIDVQIATSLSQVNLDRESVDFTVSMKEPDQQEFWSIPILDGEMVPIVSPAVWPKRVPAARALASLTQLYSENRKDDWSRWLQVAGLGDFTPPKTAGFGFSYLMYQAAINGLGIGIAAQGLVRDELKSGVLIAPWKTRLQTGDFYHLVCKRKSLRRQPVRLFADWIGERMAHMG